MKLKFEKNTAEETIVTVNGKSFASQNYIEMIRQLHLGTEIEVEFTDNITEDEQKSINEMVDAINAIDVNADRTHAQETGGENDEEDIRPEDIPF